MAEVKPFNAVYFDKSRVDYSKVIMPPYDIIKDAEIGRYYKRDEHNIIRIDKGMEEEGDSEKANKYTRAKEYFDKWTAEGILKKDDKKNFYIYAEEYNIPGGQKGEMLGFMAAVKLEEFDKRIVLPHERTHSGPKADRLLLMKATMANTSPILSFYFDKEKAVDKIIRDFSKANMPYIDTKDEKGCRHRMWHLGDESRLDAITGFFGDKQLFIADGHHRYETGLNFRNEMRQKYGAGEKPYDYIMMCLISMEHAGISILPTHRVFREFTHDDLEDAPALSRFFKAKDVRNSVMLKDMMSKNDGKKCIGVIRKNKYMLLELKEDDYKKSLDNKEHITDYYMLDVSLLHGLLFGRVLNIPEEYIFRTVEYTQDMDYAVSAVESDGAKISFIIKPATIEQVKVIAENNEVMPQKSTYFLPKLATGLLINDLKD
jgi:uncharacterized protein (DUF1015 family)